MWSATLALKARKLALSLILAAAVLYLDRQPEFAFGRVEQVVSLGSGYEFLRIEAPFRRTTALVAEKDGIKLRHPGPGDWVLVHRSMTAVEERMLFTASNLVALPLGLPTFPSTETMLRQLAAVPLVTILIGCAVLLVGAQLARLAANAATVAIGTFAIYTGLRVAAAAGWFVLPEMATLAIGILGGLVILILCRHAAADPGSLLRRIVAAAAIWILIPPIAATLGLPAVIAQGLMVAPLFVPLLAHATIAASLLAIGLAPQNELALGIIIVGCIVTALGLHSGFGRFSDDPVRVGNLPKSRASLAPAAQVIP